MSLPRSRANAHTKYHRSYGIQSQAYARASYAPGSQIAREGEGGGTFTPLFSLRQSRSEGRGKAGGKEQGLRNGLH